MFDRHRPSAVLFDCDAIKEGPDNGDPGRVAPTPGAREALSRLRRADVPVGVVTCQDGLATGRLTPDEMDRVDSRVEELLGPFDAWAICVHGKADSCTCRKPAPGLVIRVAAILDVSPRDCLVVGGTGMDMAAARAAGARGILVRTPRTSRDDVEAADEIAEDLADVADRVLSEPAPVGAGRMRGAALAAECARAVGWSRW